MAEDRDRGQAYARRSHVGTEVVRDASANSGSASGNYLRADPVQHVPAQRPLRLGGVVEVLGGVAGHTDPAWAASVA